MKKHIVSYALLAACMSAHADDTWTAWDTRREVTFEMLELADMGQTRYIAAHPNQFQEANPFFGPHPSKRTVTGWFVAGMGAHPLLAVVLPGELRPVWQWGGIVLEASVVAHNAKLGVKFNF